MPERKIVPLLDVYLSSSCTSCKTGVAAGLTEVADGIVAAVVDGLAPEADESPADPIVVSVDIVAPKFVIFDRKEHTERPVRHTFVRHL
jgi:hypothetical protein